MQHFVGQSVDLRYCGVTVTRDENARGRILRVSGQKRNRRMSPKRASEKKRMSFQNFRLDSISFQPPQTPSYSTPASTSTSTSALASTSAAVNNVQDGASRGAQRGPYGSGDMDDGYTLVFDNLEAFQAWREKEEQEKIVEFVKGDTHGSKAVPPRFKDHVKLICARHSRSGRKKYVKKYPERVRKVPSRKVRSTYVACPERSTDAVGYTPARWQRVPSLDEL
jgi:hypothetical protein